MDFQALFGHGQLTGCCYLYVKTKGWGQNGGGDMTNFIKRRCAFTAECEEDERKRKEMEIKREEISVQCDGGHPPQKCVVLL